jgi:nitrous oxidase accessory protein NosD
MDPENLFYLAPPDKSLTHGKGKGKGKIIPPQNGGDDRIPIAPARLSKTISNQSMTGQNESSNNPDNIPDNETPTKLSKPMKEADKSIIKSSSIIYLSPGINQISECLSAISFAISSADNSNGNSAINTSNDRSSAKSEIHIMCNPGIYIENFDIKMSIITDKNKDITISGCNSVEMPEIKLASNARIILGSPHKSKILSVYNTTIYDSIEVSFSKTHKMSLITRGTKTETGKDRRSGYSGKTIKDFNALAIGDLFILDQHQYQITQIESNTLLYFTSFPVSRRNVDIHDTRSFSEIYFYHCNTSRMVLQNLKLTSYNNFDSNEDPITNSKKRNIGIQVNNMLFANIKKCIISGFKYGIDINNASIKLTKNILTNNVHGIYASNAFKVICSRNIIEKSDIGLHFNNPHKSSTYQLHSADGKEHQSGYTTKKSNNLLHLSKNAFNNNRIAIDGYNIGKIKLHKSKISKNTIGLQLVGKEMIILIKKSSINNNDTATMINTLRYLHMIDTKILYNNNGCHLNTSNNSIIESCKFIANKTHGLDLHSERAICRNNLIQENKYGFILNKPCILTGNHFHHNETTALKICSSDVTINSNSFNNNKLAIEVNGNLVSFSNNHYYDNAFALFINGNCNTCQNEHIHEGQDGITITKNSKNTIIQSTILLCLSGKSIQDHGIETITENTIVKLL